jgi:hypothetical protein
MHVRFEVVDDDDNTLVSEEKFYNKLGKSIEEASNVQVRIVSKDELKKLLGL